MVYVNQCGGQDELVFDGDSFVVGADGTLLARAPQFTEGLYLVELDLPASTGNTAARAGELAVVRYRAPLPPVRRTARWPSRSASPSGCRTRPRCGARW